MSIMNDRSVKRELGETMRDIEKISEKAHTAANSLRVCARWFANGKKDYDTSLVLLSTAHWLAGIEDDASRSQYEVKAEIERLFPESEDEENGGDDK